MEVHSTVVWQLQRLIFTLILVLLLIKPTSSAIFVATAGIESLPIVYILLAVVALVVSIGYSRLLGKSHPLGLFRHTIIGSITALFVIGLLLFIPSIKLAASYIFYIFISIFGIFTASQFWILANQLFNAREARKYFGVIGFGAIAGGILGGYLASLISSVLSSEWIPVIAAGTLATTLPTIKALQTHLPSIPHGAVASQAPSIREPLRLITSSRHLSYMALVIAMSVFVSKIIDYQFGHFASIAYPIEEDLTQFYGVCMSSFNIIALLIQVVLTTRVVGKLGIAYSLLIMPAILLINAGILLVLPLLASVVALKLTDAGLKQSINKAAMELTMMPTPEDIKLKTKTFLDVFVDSLATGVSGLLLLVVLQLWHLPNIVITTIIIGSIAVWLYLTNRMRAEYKKVFRQSLNIKDAQSADATTIIKSYQRVLATGDEYQIIKTLGLIRSNPIEELEQDIAALLTNASPSIVKAALEAIMYSHSDLSSEILSLLNHDNQTIRILAFEYVINHQKSLAPDYLLSKLHSDNPSIQIIALAAYAKEFGNDHRTLQILRVEDRLSAIIESAAELHNSDLLIGCLKTIGYGKINQYYPLIDKYLQHPDDDIRQHAILAAGETRSAHYLKVLAGMISAEIVEPAVYMALAKYKTKRLATVINRARATHNAKWLEHIAMVLEQIPTSDSVALLQSLLEEHEALVRTQAIRSLRVLTDRFPLLPIDRRLLNKMLVEETKYAAKVLKALAEYGRSNHIHEAGAAPLVGVLKDKIDANLKTIFELLHIIYPPENYLQLYGYVLGDDDTLRNNAIEYVDNTISNDIKHYIMPLLEYTISFDHLPEVDELPLHEIKRFLLTNKDDDIREAALLYFG